mgnify:FL=1|tara:strand:- start:2299 stop:2697 length:399 start_codon:yes stop_codon:yes gene_type:complete
MASKQVLHIRPTIKLFITLICILQIGVLSFAIVSPDLHLLVFHNQHTDHDSNLDVSCAGHSGGNAPEHDQNPDNKKYCPVIIFAQGLDIPESHFSDNWEYLSYTSLHFSEPQLMYSVVCTSFLRQRAPPLLS